MPSLRIPLNSLRLAAPHRQRVEEARAYGLTRRRAQRLTAPRPGDHDQAA